MREGPWPYSNYPARPGPAYDSFSRSSQAFGAPFLSDDIPSLRRILAETRVIAMVGLSASWYRLSHFATKYLLDNCYHVIPVNPRYEEVFGVQRHRT